MEKKLLLSFASCVELSTWPLIVLMSPRNSSTALSMKAFVCASPFTAFSVATSGSAPLTDLSSENDCWLRAALQSGLTVSELLCLTTLEDDATLEYHINVCGSSEKKADSANKPKTKRTNNLRSYDTKKEEKLLLT